MKHRDFVNWVHGRDRKALRALIKVYGNDTNTVLNGLQAIIVRLAIGSGVEPEVFAAGMKHHWDFIVQAINESVPPRAH